MLNKGEDMIYAQQERGYDLCSTRETRVLVQPPCHSRARKSRGWHGRSFRLYLGHETVVMTQVDLRLTDRAPLPRHMNPTGEEGESEASSQRHVLQHLYHCKLLQGMKIGAPMVRIVVNSLCLAQA